MSRKPTKNKQYKSKYSEHYIGASEYIAELICEKIAIKEQRPLSTNFWLNLYWGHIYKKQLHLAKSLLKFYDARAIINALKNPKASKVYSLGMQSILDPIISEEIAKLELLKHSSTVCGLKRDIPEFPRPQVQKSTKPILDILRKLDE